MSMVIQQQALMSSWFYRERILVLEVHVLMKLCASCFISSLAHSLNSSHSETSHRTANSLTSSKQHKANMSLSCLISGPLPCDSALERASNAVCGKPSYISGPRWSVPFSQEWWQNVHRSFLYHFIEYLVRGPRSLRVACWDRPCVSSIWSCW